MGTFIYCPNWYPYCSKMKAKNYKDAWKKLKKLFPEYDVRKCIALHKSY